MLAPQSDAVMFKTYAMSASKTRVVVSIGGGFTIVQLAAWRYPP
jgi:hypothetical protein